MLYNFKDLTNQKFGRLTVLVELVKQVMVVALYGSANAIVGILWK